MFTITQLHRQSKKTAERSHQCNEDAGAKAKGRMDEKSERKKGGHASVDKLVDKVGEINKQPGHLKTLLWDVRADESTNGERVRNKVNERTERQRVTQADKLADKKRKNKVKINLRTNYNGKNPWVDRQTARGFEVEAERMEERRKQTNI